MSTSARASSSYGRSTRIRPSTTPTLTAAIMHDSGRGSDSLPAADRYVTASASAPAARVIAAVRVPPSACSTSQSSAIVFSPSAARSMHARSERPISRLISCVRPPMRPLTDSRSERVWVAAGSIAYSAVSHPSPVPWRQRGTPPVTLAVHNTRVWPNSTSTEPAGCDVNPRVIGTGRNSSSRRPSSRLDTPSTLVGDFKRLLAHHGPHRPVELGLGLGDDVLARRPRRDVRQQQLADTGLLGDLACLGAGHVQVLPALARRMGPRRLTQEHVGGAGPV